MVSQSESDTLTVKIQQAAAKALPTPSQINRLKRSGKFKALGAAISALKPRTYYDDRDYHTGNASEFTMGRSDKLNREGQEIEGRGTDVPFGPEFKTPQWDRRA